MKTTKGPCGAAALICTMLTACGAPSTSPAPATPTLASPPKPALPDFAQTTGWLGADGASSVDLNDGRVLWLFGDTFVGALKPDGGCAEGTKMVNNTFAVQTLPRGGGAGSMSFHWGPVREAEPTSWAISPAALGERAHDHWMWPAGGGIRVGTGHDEHVILFFMMMRRRDKSSSVWNFQQHGVATVTVLNPGDPVAKWRTEISPLRDHEAAIDAGEKVRMITWGPCVMPDPESADRVLIFGVDVSDGGDKRLVLARAPHASLARFETWEFRTATGWAGAESDAASLATGLVDEFSVSRVQIDERQMLMLTQIEPNLGKRILLRFADRAEGPWSEGRVFFTCPEPAQDSRLFVYSAKAHPEIAGAGTDGSLEIPVTYCVNSSDFAQVVGNVAIYRPRMVPLGWRALKAAGEDAVRRLND